MTHELFVAKIPATVSVEQLRALFERYGKIVAFKRPRDYETGELRSFAFITMSTPEEGALAIQNLNGYQLDGQPIVVKESDKPFQHGTTGGGVAPRQGGYDQGGYGGGTQGGGYGGQQRSGGYSGGQSNYGGSSQGGYNRDRDQGSSYGSQQRSGGYSGGQSNYGGSNQGSYSRDRDQGSGQQRSGSSYGSEQSGYQQRPTSTGYTRDQGSYQAPRPTGSGYPSSDQSSYGPPRPASGGYPREQGGYNANQGGYQARSVSSEVLPSGPEDLQWEERADILDQLADEIGTATSVKVTVIGRPAEPHIQGNTVVLMMQYMTRSHQFPQGIPQPDPFPMNLAVYLHVRHWERVSQRLETDPQETLVVEGLLALDTDSAALAVFAINVSLRSAQGS